MEIQLLRDELTEKEFQLAFCKKQLESITSVHEQQKARLELYEQSLTSTEGSLQAVSTQLKMSLVEISNLNLRIRELEAEVESYKNRKISRVSSVVSAPASPLDEQNRKLKAQVASLEELNRSRMMEISQLRDFEIASIKSQVISLEQELEGKNHEIQVQASQLDQKQKRIEELEKDVENYLLEIKQLKEVLVLSFFSCPTSSASHHNL